MSRSRKKIAIWKQLNDKCYKRLSNKRVRHMVVASGGDFKKLLHSWLICDRRWFAKEEEDVEKALRK